MGRFGDRFRNFMIGRYGMDEFGRFMNIGTLILLVISMVIGYISVIPRLVSYILWLVTLALIIYSYVRIFSRNHSARVKENQWFLRVSNKLTNGRFSAYSQNPYNNSNYGQGYGYGYDQGYGAQSKPLTNEQKKKLDRRTHKIFKCPNCSQKIRVPKHRGKICIKCPNCRIEFIRKT